jgi:fructose-1,6-bisphosphatase II
MPIEAKDRMKSQSPSYDAERTIELDFVRATEAAALTVFKWIGKGDKNGADGAACDAIEGMFELIDASGTVSISEGAKDEAPHFHMGKKLGRWRPGSVKFDIAIDPIDGTTNLSNGLPNSISVLCAASPEKGIKQALKHVPSFYSKKIGYGPQVKAFMERKGNEQIHLEQPIEANLRIVARALNKRVQDLTVVMLARDRHKSLMKGVRSTGAALRMIGDGDITAAIAPSMPESGVDLYVGIGGSPEGVIAAAAIKCVGGDLQMKMWPKDGEELADLKKDGHHAELDRIYTADDLAHGKNIIFCATGITDSSLLPGVRFFNHSAVTYSILMRAKQQTVRYLKTIHNLESKTIRLSSDQREHKL